jgi:hypothetical protein
MEKHDLLVLNNSSYDSKTFEAAIEEFRKPENREFIIDGEDTPDSILDTGFEYGFWSAVKVLTGYGDGH